MEVRAVAKYIRVQPRKVRLVAHEVIGKPAQKMADILRFHPSKGAFYLRKVIMSAVANAEENHGLSADVLIIKEVRADEGPRIKRIQARAMGRANRILKRTSHITVVVDEFEPQATVKPHGTKAKARPSFEKVKPAKGKAKGDSPKAAEETKVVAEVVENQVEAPVEATPAAGEQPTDSKD